MPASCPTPANRRCASGRPAKGNGRVHPSNRGSQYLSIRDTERLAEAGIEPSLGSLGDAYDNARAAKA